MPQKKPFIDKILSRLERIDKKALQTHIQELARDNAQWHEILESVDLGIFIISKDLRLRYANRKAMMCLGMTEEDVLHATPINQIIQDPYIQQFMDQSLPSLNQTAVEDFRILEPRPLDLRMHFMPMQSGTKGNILAIAQPISDARSQRAQKQILARQEALLRLAAGVAHEIGNPLNAINIHLGLLRKKVGISTARSSKSLLETVDILAAETQRLDRIVRNFLKATRKPPLRFRPEDLNQVVKGAVDIVSPQLHKARVEITVRTDTKLAPFLFDRERIHEALINLIKNAAEAMPRGGHIRLATSQKGGIAVLRVTDTGTGISDEHLAHIFDAYYTTKNDGTGLGLWMVYQAVAEHGGRIDVMTREKKGTTFTLFLPMHKEKLQLPNYDIEKEKD